ncbi:MAG: tetratricopeptide repeat protein [Alphaproteobacteria bacterium]
MTSRIKDVPGYVIIGSILLLGLAAWGIYGASHLFSHKSDFEKLTSYKNAEEMLAAQAAYREQVERSILELGETGAILKKAETGDAEAQYQLGNLYFYGIKGHELDLAKAREWFDKAVQQNYGPAEYQIGAMYLRGLGCRESKAEALKWYIRAAEHGDDWAQRHVGEIYLSFLNTYYGVEQNFEEAYFWLYLGTIGHDPNENFVEHRESAKGHLTAEQLTSVKKRIEEWQDAHPVPAEK